jgi:hypothetical protein
MMFIILPDDLTEYLENNAPDINKKKVIQEIIYTCEKIPENAAEYADIYAKRTLRIINMLK